MSESRQRILTRRALDGHYPRTPDEFIAWWEAAARGWNQDPTPFVWGGKRAVRRLRARTRRHAVGGSGTCTAAEGSAAVQVPSRNGAVRDS